MDGSYELVELLDIDINFETMIPHFKIRLQHGIERTVTKEHLSPKDAEYLFQLHISANQVREHAELLDTNTLQAILHPQVFPPCYERFMLAHDRLGHLLFVDMFTLAENGRLLKKYLQLKGRQFFCPSCDFAKAKRRNWRDCGAPGSLRSATQVNPGDCTSINQVISAYLGLVSRIYGYHSRDRIHCGTIFYDNISTLSFTHLQYSTEIVQV